MSFTIILPVWIAALAAMTVQSSLVTPLWHRAYVNGRPIWNIWPAASCAKPIAAHDADAMLVALLDLVQTNLLSISGERPQAILQPTR